MHYYSQNIADYRKDTGHLSHLEHGIYRQLMDSYYLEEKPIQAKNIARKMSVRAENEEQALKNVLEDFFSLSDCGEFYTHKRIDAEIAKYKAKADQARVNGKKGGRPQKPTETQGVNSGLPTETQPVISGNPDVTQTKANSLTHELNNSVTQEPSNSGTKELGNLGTHEPGNPETKSSKQKPPAKKPAGDYPEDFEIFWDLYPKKVGKKTSLAVWKKMTAAERMLAVEKLPAAKKSPKFTDDNGKWIKDPERWLKSGGWDDEHGSSHDDEMAAMIAARKRAAGGFDASSSGNVIEGEIVYDSPQVGFDQ